MTEASADPQLALPSGSLRGASAGDASYVVPEGTTRPADVPAAIFAGASAAYLAGERLDMQQLALGLGISRATLYRKAGNRDRLLASVIWWHGRWILVDAMERTTRLKGVDRIIAVTHLVLTMVDQSLPLRQLVAAEPEVAMRVLTGARGHIQGHYVDSFERLFALEVGRGHVSFSLDLPSLAYAVVRVAEGFLYADVIGDRERDIERAEAVIAGLLRGLDSTGRAG